MISGTLKAALLPALTMLTGRATSKLTANGGGYAGIDLNGAQPFAGMQGRLNPPDAPVQIVPSAEGGLQSDSDRWQYNADALYPFGATGALDAPQRTLVPYAGGGLCLVRSAKKSLTRVGINVIGGATIRFGSFEAFAQMRLTVADGVHLSLTGGAVPSSR